MKKLYHTVRINRVGTCYNKGASGGFTPLFIAARNGDADIVKLLLNIDGIDVDKTCIYGQTALDIARKNKRIKIVSMLLEKAKPSDSGSTPAPIDAESGADRAVEESRLRHRFS